jgi:hypothetical protein
VWLGGAQVHHHPYPFVCTAACRSYWAGWYTPEQALAIIGRLPGIYAEAIERLTAMAAQGAA